MTHSRLLSFCLQHPSRIERDIKAYKKALMGSVVADDSREQTIDLIVWFDGYRADATAVKFRLFDRTGCVLPQRITPPMTLLMYQGSEKFLPDFFGTIERLLRSLVDVPLPSGVSHYRPASRIIVRLLGLSGDHKALQIVSGVKRGGYYRSPFSSLNMFYVATDPFKDRCNRLTLRDTVSLRFNGLTPDTQRFGQADGRNIDMCCFSRLTSSGIHEIQPMFAGTLLIPPVMHISHYLMKDLWIVLGLIKKSCAGSNVYTLDKIEADFKRTTGCNEQSWNRRKLATLVNDHIDGFDSTLRSFIFLIGKLQALYYSSDHVTDATIAFHHAASLAAFMFFHQLTLHSKRDKNKATRSDEYRLTYQPKFTGSLYLNAVVSVLPVVHSQLRIGLRFLLEEYFERDFLLNAQVRQEKHRAWLLGFIIQKISINRIISSHTRRGSTRKHGQVKNIAVECKSICFHKCLFDAWYNSRAILEMLWLLRSEDHTVREGLQNGRRALLNLRKDG
ncbi:hypothetical protein J8273_7060 [Carpediemonas membranifera]|uniref:Uncharacterized protein n=1 Tax=Carpediemonas membranifera TaxID=201153 RepID=A0A8J6E7K2_9EUKA|nr:hypothetical protein J8273_7060 [Carpediemonas membranifera]|eukprot:KAG9390805.1 hypothetical protein J8273_7060 [Carpediemonas membranifera]